MMYVAIIEGVSSCVHLVREYLTRLAQADSASMAAAFQACGSTRPFPAHISFGHIA